MEFCGQSTLTFQLNVEFLFEKVEHNTFAVCWVFNNFVAPQDMVSNHMQKKPLNISAGRLY
jgi:hypothetical protein